PDHLLAGTHGDNVKDKVNRNRQSRGWKHYNSKLTEKAVEELRALKKPNFKELADQYMMSVGALKSAYYGHTWKHVPLQEEIQTRAQETLTYVTSEAYVSSRDADDVSESGGSTDAKNEED